MPNNHFTTFTIMQVALNHNYCYNEFALLRSHFPMKWTCDDARISSSSKATLNTPLSACQDRLLQHSHYSLSKNEYSTCELRDPTASSSETEGDDDSCTSVDSHPASHSSSLGSYALQKFLQDLLGDVTPQCTIVDDQWITPTFTRKTQPAQDDREVAVTVHTPGEDLPRLLSFSQEHAAFI